jgi:hypothetical protein
MKKAFPIALMVLGLVLAGAGVYTLTRGFQAKDDVKTELVAQNITTPADASMPNVQVKDAATAESMARIIDHHSLTATGGLTYAELGRFNAKDGNPAGTNDATLAALDANGNPISNTVRNTAFQASALQTSLWSSVLAFNVADLVVGLGLMIVFLGLAIGGVGLVLLTLAAPKLAHKVHVDPVATHEVIMPTPSAV